MGKVIALSEAKARLSEIMREVSETRDVVTITRGGRRGVFFSAPRSTNRSSIPWRS